MGQGAPSSSAFSQGEKGPARLAGNLASGGISNWGLVWLNLASFTPSGEAGNEATVASFGTLLTRRHCASVASWRPRLVSSGVAGSGETFNSLPFASISTHFPSSEPSSFAFSL